MHITVAATLLINLSLAAVCSISFSRVPRSDKHSVCECVFVFAWINIYTNESLYATFQSYLHYIDGAGPCTQELLPCAAIKMLSDGCIIYWQHALYFINELCGKNRASWAVWSWHIGKVGKGNGSLEWDLNVYELRELLLKPSRLKTSSLLGCLTEQNFTLSRTDSWVASWQLPGAQVHKQGLFFCDKTGFLKGHSSMLDYSHVGEISYCCLWTGTCFRYFHFLDEFCSKMEFYLQRWNFFSFFLLK